MEVYKAINEVAAELAQTGISKDRKNVQQGFMFRGIDAVYNHLAPILAKHKLCILPRIIGRTVTERTTQKGGALFYVTVEAEFDFVSAIDGSKHTVKTFGEAMDSGDKATNKAMSVAYKYAAFQSFCIPTEETAADPDAETHQVAANPADIAMEWIAALDKCETLESLKDTFADAWVATKKHKAVQNHYNNLKTKFEGAAQ